MVLFVIFVVIGHNFGRVNCTFPHANLNVNMENIHLNSLDC